MPLNKVKEGNNMYQKWVHATWNPLAGECEYKCKYCYVNSIKKSYHAIAQKYTVPYRLIEKELKENLYKFGEGITIFVQSMGDLFANGIPAKFILQILEYCNKYPDNQYLFQSKNPKNFQTFYSKTPTNNSFPKNTILCTTIETNRDISKISKAPSIESRAEAMRQIRYSTFHNISVTIEPILDFDLEPFVKLLKDINPDIINIGADSKNNNLPEPSSLKIRKLIKELRKIKNTDIKIKHNLKRLLKDENGGKK